MTNETTSKTYRSRQEIFDIAYRGLSAQGWKQSRSAKAFGCAYRGADGCKCAIGHLIADADYNEAFESKNLNHAGVQAAAGISLVDKTFGRELQWAHDDAYNPADMRDRLDRLAEKYGLTIPQIEGAAA